MPAERRALTFGLSFFKRCLDPASVVVAFGLMFSCPH